MSDSIPFFLSEAVLTLYPASADGSLIAGAPVWSGALATRLQMTLDYEEVKLMASGAAYARVNHVDEETVLKIGRTWILRKSALADFKPGRNQQYVLQLVWNAEGCWLARTFYGVTARTTGWNAPNTNQFLNDQVFRAQYFVDAGGTAAAVYTPVVVDPGTPEPFGFFREDPFVVGEYLLGYYVWRQAVELGVVQFIGSPPQGSPSVLTLEVGGNLTDLTLTVPVGPANVPVEVDINLGNYPVAAGQALRWKITDGPAPEAAAWQAALMMGVIPL